MPERECRHCDPRIMLTNGAMVVAYGPDQSLRGVRHGKERPGLIMAYDLEDQEHVISEEHRQKLREWFDRTLLHAGHTETNVIVIGTALHHYSLLANLLNPRNSGGWTSQRYQAVFGFADRSDLWNRWAAIFNGTAEHGTQSDVDAAQAYFAGSRDPMLLGTRVLWPERESYYDLMVMRQREGRASFQARKHSEPLNSDQCVFSSSSCHFWDDAHPDEEALLRSLQKNGRFYGACDPSLATRTGKGDYTAIVILYRDKQTKIKYVVGADIAWRTPDQTIERILHYAKMYQFDRFAVEANHFQAVIVDNLERRANEAGAAQRGFGIGST